ncbi:MAG: type II glyceraldehyde-3-phosphate dehydrogenase [Gemmatimonadetes bacterium]|nr:type II glyceraldehyde-3-phosphate dehydrogenase [Gemmatimonadota bacterium]
MIRVAVNGYGVIGRRVADAVVLQADMELVGVADVATDWRGRIAARRGFPLFAATTTAHTEMIARGFEPRGDLDALLDVADIVVDCTPKGVDAGNKPRYEQAGIRTVFQGGSAHELAGHSFVASANYRSALDRRMTRVVSCNTTATVRTLFALQQAGLLRRARGVLVRRATDPWESHRGGILNTMVPEPDIPSHQGPDAKTVIPGLDVITMASKSPQNVAHLHHWMVDLTRIASRDEVLAAFRAVPRIAFVRVDDGVEALNVTAEIMKEIGRPRGDMWEVAIWEDILAVEGQELLYAYQVDNQAIVVPETIDAIRALMGTERDASRSIRMTNEALGVCQEFP